MLGLRNGYATDIYLSIYLYGVALLVVVVCLKSCPSPHPGGLVDKPSALFFEGNEFES